MGAALCTVKVHAVTRFQKNCFEKTLVAQLHFICTGSHETFIQVLGGSTKHDDINIEFF